MSSLSSGPTEFACLEPREPPLFRTLSSSVKSPMPMGAFPSDAFLESSPAGLLLSLPARLARAPDLASDLACDLEADVASATSASAPRRRGALSVTSPAVCRCTAEGGVLVYPAGGRECWCTKGAPGAPLAKSQAAPAPGLTPSLPGAHHWVLYRYAPQGLGPAGALAQLSLARGGEKRQGREGNALWALLGALLEAELRGSAPEGPALEDPVVDGTVLEGAELGGPVLEGPVLDVPLEVELGGPVLEVPVLDALQGTSLRLLLHDVTTLNPSALCSITGSSGSGSPCAPGERGTAHTAA